MPHHLIAGGHQTPHPHSAHVGVSLGLSMVESCLPGCDVKVANNWNCITWVNYTNIHRPLQINLLYAESCSKWLLFRSDVSFRWLIFTLLFSLSFSLRTGTQRKDELRSVEIQAPCPREGSTFSLPGKPTWAWQGVLDAWRISTWHSTWQPVRASATARYCHRLPHVAFLSGLLQPLWVQCQWKTPVQCMNTLRWSR